MQEAEQIEFTYLFNKSKLTSCLAAEGQNQGLQINKNRQKPPKQNNKTHIHTMKNNQNPKFMQVPQKQWGKKHRNAGKVTCTQRSDKDRGKQTDLNSQGKINKTQVKAIRVGQTITAEGKEPKTGKVKRNKTHREKSFTSRETTNWIIRQRRE